MQRLRILREQRRMNQQRLAIELNVTQAMISKYELGITEPDCAMIKQIAKYFGVSADYLLELADEKTAIAGLTDDEKEFLSGFRELNDIQKAKCLAYIQGLLQK